MTNDRHLKIQLQLKFIHLKLLFKIQVNQVKETSNSQNPHFFNKKKKKKNKDFAQNDVRQTSQNPASHLFYSP